MNQARYFYAFILSSLSFILLYFAFISLPKAEKKLKPKPSQVIKIALITPVTPIKKVIVPPKVVTAPKVMPVIPIPQASIQPKQKVRKTVVPIKKPIVKKKKVIKKKKIIKKKIVHKKKVHKKKVHKKVKPKKKVHKKKIHKKKVHKKKIVKKKIHKKKVTKKIVHKKRIPKKVITPEPIIEEYIPQRVNPQPIIEEYVPPIVEAPVYYTPPPVPKPVMVAAPVIKASSQPVAPRQNNQHKKAFLRNVRSQIIANKRYPKLARRRHIEGSVKVRFDIDSNGGVRNIRFISGKRIFQKSIRKTLERTFPMAIPSNVQASLPISNISVVLHFNLR